MPQLEDTRTIEAPVTVEVLRAFQDRLASFPSGHFRGRYQGRSYGISLMRPLPGIEKLYAEELGGSDIISFNYYIPSRRAPCSNHAK
jgi:hypothetical protein